MKIFFDKHYGVSIARNTGINVAQGRYIAFMDCDDILYKDFYLNSLPLLETNADIYIFSFDRVNADGTVSLTMEEMVAYAKK